MSLDSSCVKCVGVARLNELVIHALHCHARLMPLQVAEHIPAQHEQTFLENVYRHAALGVVLSWAVPGQVQP